MKTAADAGPSLSGRLRAAFKRPRALAVAAAGLGAIAAATLFIACGGSSGTSNPVPPPTPAISNINNATAPASPISRSIEINGSGFESAPGKVIFSQTSSGLTATVTPDSSGWTNGGVTVTVPAGDGSNNFDVPGTVSVTVQTTGGTSNAKDLALVQPPTLTATNLAWTTTTPLPFAMAGFGAVAVPVSDTSAFVVTAGGNDGTNNDRTNVYSNTILTDGKVGPDWTTLPTTALPATRAYAAMVEADPSNSPVSANSRFIYVIGGQASASDAPGGTNTVYLASVNTNSGAVGSWTATSQLPETLVGPAAALLNGYVYVVGGLRSGGTPSPNVYSAKVNSNGTLGAWTTSPNPYPQGISFGTAFGFAGRLYVLNGDNTSSTTPRLPGGTTGVTDVYDANVSNGSVGAWTSASSTVMGRKKHVTWNDFGQLIDAEGIYGGLTVELEQSVVNADGTLGAWSGIFAANSPAAHVYNAAAVASPFLTSTPHFILIGGQSVVTQTPSALVYYNNN